MIIEEKSPKRENEISDKMRERRRNESEKENE